MCMRGDTQRIYHVQWRQTGHRTDTMDACRAVNQWPTTGNWHNTTWQLTRLLVNKDFEEKFGPIIVMITMYVHKQKTYCTVVLA